MTTAESARRLIRSASPPDEFRRAEYQVAEVEAVDSRPDANYDARHLAPRDEWGRRLELIEVPGHQEVRKGDGTGADLDHHRACDGRGLLDLRQLQAVRTPERSADYRPQAATL